MSANNGASGTVAGGAADVATATNARINANLAGDSATNRRHRVI
jgi:hypothetical protein